MELVDRALVARVIEREMDRHPEIRRAKSRLAHRAHITRTTLDSALDPKKWDSTSSATYSAINGALGLPPFAMDNIRKHAWDTLREDGVDPELLAWMQREVAKREQGNTGTDATEAL